MTRLVLLFAFVLPACGGPALAPVQRIEHAAPAVQAPAASNDYEGIPQATPYVQAGPVDLACVAASCDAQIDLTGIGDVELGAAAAILRDNLYLGTYAHPERAQARLKAIDDTLIQRSKQHHPAKRFRTHHTHSPAR